MAGLKSLTGRFRLKGWTAVVLGGLVLTIIAMIDNGQFTPSPVLPAADGSTGCEYRVTATTPDASGARELNVRTAAAADGPVKGTVADGTVIDGTNVVTNGYRQVEGGLWVSADHLTRVSGTNCG